MKKRFLSLLLCAALALSLTACGDEAEPSSPPDTKSARQTDLILSNPDGDTWTVLVYLCGTDLETYGGYASINVVEMAEAAQSENVNVLIQTGGTEEWAIDAIDPSELQRWQVVSGDIELVDSQSLANMGEAETLGDFLRWGAETYPADKYMALLWDHGGGSVAGIAGDELYGGDMLDLKELAQGVSMAGVQFELVGFDACLMSTMETAAALTPYARYMVASQELEPGTGWHYTDWLSYAADNPTADGLDVGSRICDGFYAKCAADGTESLATLAVTDLSKLPALTAAFDAMAAEMKGFTAETDKLQPLTQAIVRAENYGGNNDSEGYTNMVDLGDLALCAEGVLTETGNVVLAALADAVPYAVAGEGRQRGHGLSVYVPLAIAEGELDSYAALAATSGEYLRFLEGLYDWTVPSGVTLTQPVYPTGAVVPIEEQTAVDEVEAAQALDSGAFTVDFTTELTDDGSVLLTMNSGAEIISTVAFNLYYQDDESGELWYLGSDFDVNQDDMGTRFWDNYRNTWTIINDCLCMMVALNFTDEYILYTVPVQVNGEDTNLRLLYHMDSGVYEVIGTWDGVDAQSGMASRDVRKLQDGDTVDFVFDAADLNTGEDTSFVAEGFTVSGPIIAEEAVLFDGTYYYEYELTDLFGNVYTSDLAVLTVENGEMTISM
ncbi:MAG: clostripain-related cysteine peptidase [Oscillibacter ruminantium]|uniref:clostripain-related cysteine peptidase n=1 Tax=Oscillibacter ruminantium TaxID=1263547 RepID=UPI002B1F212D|nr:clostripain-related cysteine peptidase [Oscillibacter ruminantium]MEA5041862.1 clostripain-related cysteine peptidase [Oscillibacter ruminantium]